MDKLTQGARKLVQHNGRVKPDEKVLIITDPSLQPIAELVTAEAKSVGAETVLVVMPERSSDGQEPPEMISAAMTKADVVFTPVKKSITHTRAFKDALANGARGILMTAYTEHVLSCPALLETDFVSQEEICYKLGDAFNQGNSVHLTSEKGTDLTFSIQGRQANVLTGMPSPGQLAPVPTIEVNVVPVHGSAQGVLVADASIPYLGIGVLKEPVTCIIENGYVVCIRGGRQAQVLEEQLVSMNDRNCFNIAELGVGLNPNANLTGFMLEDEGVLGTIHIGIGTSITLGGEISAPSHYDLLMWAPTLKIDGHIIQNNKQLI